MKLIFSYMSFQANSSQNFTSYIDEFRLFGNEYDHLSTAAQKLSTPRIAKEVVTHNLEFGSAIKSWIFKSA